MPKATIRLVNGTVAQIDGTLEEIKVLLEFYGASKTDYTTKSQKDGRTAKRETVKREAKDEIAINDIVRQIKDCELADSIEKQILESTSRVNRILLPIFIAQERLKYSIGLTTGEISSVTRDLGVPIHVANISNVIKTNAARYVYGDKVRKKGLPIRYKLTNRGVRYIKSVIAGKSDGE